MADKQIKVAFCAAYDWYFLKHSIPLVYKKADLICVAIDKDRISWAGKPYSIDEAAFASFLKEVDPEKKIMLYEDDFHRPKIGPMDNEVRQRNMMATAMGSGGWHLQLDSDEYFINFEGFVRYLKGLNPSRLINVECPLLILYKNVEGGYLTIDNKMAKHSEFIAIASQHPRYEHGRKNGYFNVKTDFAILHQSWARSEEEIGQKIENWGHRDDFDAAAYFQRWKDLSADNHASYVNLHPLKPDAWAALKLVKANSIEELVRFFRENPPLKMSAAYLRKTNSIWLSRFNSLLKKFN